VIAVRSEAVLRFGIVALLVAAVEMLCRLHIIPVDVMIAPSQMAAELMKILVSGEYSTDIISSIANVLISTVLSVTLGFVAGLIIYSAPSLRAALEPLLASYYAVPTFIFYPVFISLFGVGSGAIVAIAVLLAIVSMITATLNGLDRIPRVLRKTGRIYRMSRIKMAVMIELPSAAPSLFTGVKLSVAYSFIGVIASEFILSGSGIGYAIAYAYNNFENRHMYALMLLIILLVTGVNALLNGIDRRLQSQRHR
jgi:NitT/TauT family transport system permease protein